MINVRPLCVTQDIAIRLAFFFETVNTLTISDLNVKHIKSKGQTLRSHTSKASGLPIFQLKQDAGRGGNIAGIARKELEKEIGRTVVSKENYLPKKKSKKSLT